MKALNNDLLSKKWINLILSIYNGDIYYQKLKQKVKISKINLSKILNNQLTLLKIRKKEFENITINYFENFSFLENIC